MSKKNSKSSGKESLTKVDFKKHLIVVGIVIIIIFLFAVVYSSYEGNIAGEAGRKPKKSSSSSSSSGGNSEGERIVRAADAAGVPVPEPPLEPIPTSTSAQKVEDCKTAARAAGGDESTCKAKVESS